MRLGTIKNGTRDGALVIVNDAGTHYISAEEVAPNLQHLLDHWDQSFPKLKDLAKNFTNKPSNEIDFHQFEAPLPRAYEWIDGSAYINHIVLVRKARGAEPPPTLETDPLVYQGGSGIFLGPREDIPGGDPTWGLDFESEVCVILGDTPQGVKPEDAHKYIRLVLLANDVSLRNLIPNELQKGFGFFTSKPATAFSPFCLTPDELGEHWKGGRLHLPLVTTLNDEKYGDPNAGPEMHFSFYDLIAHITKTRSYTAGTILGSGTVSNLDRAKGSSCLAEKRMIEKIDLGDISTEFMKKGDRVRIEMFDPNGKSLFGAIDQSVS